MPDAWRTRSLVCNLVERTRVRNHRLAETIRHSLHDGLRLIPRSPRSAGLLASVAWQDRLRDLTPASGCRDHTALPSATVALVRRNSRVHRIPRPRP